MLNHKGSDAQCQRPGNFTKHLLYATALLAVAGCGDKPSSPTATPQTTASASPPIAPAVTPSALQTENERLKAEIVALKAQVEDLSQTPEALLGRVKELVKSENLSEAQATSTKLEQRYGPDGQAKVAKAAVAQLATKLEAQKEQARQLEARGFYALKPSKSVEVEGFVIKVDSLGLGDRWVFNERSDEYSYRNVERGQKFVLLKTTLQNTNKNHNPNLPDIAVYAIEGKQMRHVAAIEYEFRRWSNYGSFIGLYHDYKNDFAHSAAIPFNAAASIDEDVAKGPFAVVSTGKFCHSRVERTGRPEVGYHPISGCEGKAVLTAEDFGKGEYRVLSFFNKPKGI